MLEQILHELLTPQDPGNDDHVGRFPNRICTQTSQGPNADREKEVIYQPGHCAVNLI